MSTTAPKYHRMPIPGQLSDVGQEDALRRISRATQFKADQPGQRTITPNSSGQGAVSIAPGDTTLLIASGTTAMSVVFPPANQSANRIVSLSFPQNTSVQMLSAVHDTIDAPLISAFVRVSNTYQSDSLSHWKLIASAQPSEGNANLPVHNKGDLLTSNGSVAQALPVTAHDYDVLRAHAGAPSGLGLEYGGLLDLVINLVNVPYSVVATDRIISIIGGTGAVSLPTAASTYPRGILIKNGTTTSSYNVNAAGTDRIENGLTAFTLNTMGSTSHCAAIFMSNGSNGWYAFGMN